MRRALCICLMAALPALAAADVIFFSVESEFNNQIASRGLTPGFGPEDFEENSMGTGETHPLNDPLTQGTANGVFPAGLSHAVTIQSNMLGGAAVNPSPRGMNGLVAIANGAGYGEVSDVVLSNFQVDSTDLIFPSPTYAVAFDALSLNGTSVRVEVYDAANSLLGQAIMSARISGVYAGVASDLPFTRINIWDSGGRSEGADNLMGYVPEPTGLALLALATALLRRR